MKSPHDTKMFVGLVFPRIQSTYEYVQLMMGNGVKPYIIKNCLPWHVNGNITFLVDSDSLQCRSDIGVDAWRWEIYKTQTTSTDDLSGESLYVVKDNALSFRIVKRYYRSKSNEDLKRQIVAIYPPRVPCKAKSNPFQNCEGVVIISYSFGQERLIKPDKNPKVYESVKANIREQLKYGHNPARATYESEKELGGLESIANASSLPRRRHAYEENRKKAKVDIPDDPLRELLTKQRQEGRTGHPIIRRITMDEFSYSIALFNDNVIRNIANYCCNEKEGYKSPLVFDFTFELLKQPPFYALVGSYKNTSLYVKGAARSPCMLGPVFLCHSRKETTTKVLFDAMLEVCPGLGAYLQVIGYDGEKALSNNGCAAFPAALLLLCANHAKKNIQEKLRDLVNDSTLRKSVYSQIFGDEFSNGLAFSVSPDAFDQRLHILTTEWHKDERLHKFAQYFEIYKADQFRYHLVKGVVDKAKIVDVDGLFTTNLAECINSVIKLWQNGKLDPLNFSIAYEKMLEQQESNVLRSFLHLDSPYEVREEFQNSCIDFTSVYAQKTTEEKEEVKKKLTNVLVDEARYNEVIRFKPGPVALEKVRSNVTSLFQTSLSEVDTSFLIATCSSVQQASTLPATDHKSDDGSGTQHGLRPIDESSGKSYTSLSSDEIRSVPHNQYQASAKETYTFLISSAKPHLTTDSVMATVAKAMSIVQQKEILHGFEEGKRLVKSYTNQQPHIVSLKKATGDIKCDLSCLHFKHEAYCAHTLAVAIFENCVETFAAYLTRTDKHSINAVGAANVNTSKVGKKKPQRQYRQRKQVTVTSGKDSCASENFQVTTAMQQPHPQQPSLPLPNLQHAYMRQPSLPPPNLQQPYLKQHNFAQASQLQQPFALPPAWLHNNQQLHETGQPPTRQFMSQSGAYTRSHNMLAPGQVVLTSLHACDSRVSSCYGCGKSIRMTLQDGRRVVPNAPDDLVLIAKVHRAYRKDGVTKVSPSPRNVYFHTTINMQQLICIKNVLNINHDRIQIDASCLPYLNQCHVGYILFTLELPHLAPHLALVKN